MVVKNEPARSWKVAWSTPSVAAFIAACSLLLTASPAHAYLGPSIGLGVIGGILGVFGSLLLALFAVVWYPIKRLIRRFRRSRVKPGSAQAADEN